MTIYNFGSINLDHVYQVDHFVRPGETMASESYQCLLGGKGANQSAALAKAGADVKHVGAVHTVDKQVLRQLQEIGVDTALVAQLDMPTGHAIIQINKSAENSIILYPGANHCLTEAQVDEVLKKTSEGDWVLLQNETNLVDYVARQAKSKSLKVAYNPAPMNVEMTKPLLSSIDLLIVNEVEAMDLVAVSSIEEAVEAMPKHYPDLAVLMTLGSDGVRYFDKGVDLYVPAFSVDAIDTTAAGDTFIGFSMAALFNGQSIEDAIKQGCAASAICVTRIGALAAIPELEEVTTFMSHQQ
ncbi:ribokinase [Marinomonas mediterranea]|jgi:Sugar kinases, ribokinase family|uniref:Ribokinase n=1 Tax=Marinomonas mediterranea (strain ATCC 700492 / JCM 21426 / NBRC 103028 / MMB-1) TaxID=717774 RepID=F2K0R0_MARM1|nr:ribokinase [Marinomonas mediterranea]ADZ92152.1 Ribokinase [Marinomonas mediterranea MMB-1]WCN14158.1 ribokinase [Marinomonas mediterranea]WCN18214.1 ribokinase [Marinomonas mediterranea MMB-1]